jgi:hypothetical protein
MSQVWMRNGQWFFYEEDGATEHGPYDTMQEAETFYRFYCDSLDNDDAFDYMDEP